MVKRLAVSVIVLLGVTLPLAGTRAQDTRAPDLLAEIRALLRDAVITTEGDRQVVALSLADVLKLALARSLALQSTRMGEEIAQSGVTSALNRNHPDFANSVEVGRSLSAFPSFGAGSRTDAVTYSATLTKPLDNGIKLSAKFSEVYSNVQGFTINSSGQASGFSSGTNFETSALTGAVSIPIFQDWGQELNEVPVRLAEAGLEGSRVGTRQAKLALLRAVASTYWDLVGTLQNIRVAEDAVKLSEQLLRDNQERLKAGVLSPADVKVSESQLSNDRQSLLAARVEYQRIEDQVRAALNLADLKVGLKPVEEPTLREEVFPFDQLLQRALANDPTLGSLQTQLERNRWELEQALNKDRTNLDLDFSYTLNGYGKNTGDATSGLTDTQLHGYAAKLTWTVPLFDQITPETIRQRQLERAQLNLNVANQKSEITVSVQTDQRLLRLAEQEVKTARVSVALQNELLQNEIERLKLGESTSYRVAQVQQDNAVARQREILARIRYEKFFLELLLVTGDIYAQYGLPADAP